MEEKINKITESEFEVIKVMWDFGKPITFTEIRERVQNKKGWSQSTIKTLLYRLHEKGVISQEKKDVYYYAPLVSEKEYKDYTTQSLIDKLYKGKAINLLASLVNSNRLDEDDIDELRTLLHEEDD